MNLKYLEWRIMALNDKQTYQHLLKVGADKIDAAVLGFSSNQIVELVDALEAAEKREQILKSNLSLIELKENK